MHKLPKVRVPRFYKRKEKMPAPSKPRIAGEEPEILGGVVQDLPASQYEERYAKALDARRESYIFRYTFVAPRGMPGSFEVDFLVLQNGMVYPVEIDTVFTHRNKGRKDVLHDSRVLTELEQEGFSFFPKVTHIDGELKLMDSKSAKALIKEMFGGYGGIETPAPFGEAVYNNNFVVNEQGEFTSLVPSGTIRPTTVAPRDGWKGRKPL